MDIRRILTTVAALLVAAAQLALPAVALADGIIIVEPPICDPGPCPGPIPIADQLEIKFHRVDVTIRDQVAVTRIDQVFHNPNDWVAEGTYIFPIPDGATISEFVMWADGEPVQATLMEADKARQIYDDIVRRMRDPAILEYLGQGAIQASVFPIKPGDDRRIEIEYSEVLTVENGLVHYVYPLNTERFSARPLDHVSVRVEVESPDPVRAVYSPSHEIAVNRLDDYRFVAGYEDIDVRPETDFELFYGVSQRDIGANLISYYDDVTSEGYFMLLASPGIATTQQVIAKDVILVLDTSGSMHGEKLDQARDALVFVLDSLNPEDRFNIVEFSTGVRTYAHELQPARDADNAIDWVKRIGAIGGTDINLALQTAIAMADSRRPQILIFLTDGLPTEGIIEIPDILDNVAGIAPENVRLFAFGVGDDVDTILLDSLAEAHHGASSYVRPGQRLDETVAAFYAKVSAPVLASPQLDFGHIRVDDVLPDPLPDLFAGTQLVVLGRYREGGPATITLSGSVNGDELEFQYDDLTFRRSGGEEFLPRLWATRRIGYLLNQIRLHGEREEWVQAVVELSVRYGIVTPYTSYLITEDDILTQEGQAAAADEEFERLQTAPAEPSSGEAAVSEAEALSGMSAADVAPAPEAAFSDVVKVVGSRAFVLQGETWVETAFDPGAMTAAPVQFASDDYFDLLAARPDLGPAFALGPRVIAISGGQAFEVVEEAAPALDLEAVATGEPERTPLPGDAVTEPSEVPAVDPPAPARGLPCSAAMLPLALVAFSARRRRRLCPHPARRCHGLASTPVRDQGAPDSPSPNAG
ncbi:MAG: VIT domain-containing protein [Anaerolineales bacterium]